MNREMCAIPHTREEIPISRNASEGLVCYLINANTDKLHPGGAKQSILKMKLCSASFLPVSKVAMYEQKSNEAIYVIFWA